jgi:hypothetical protein
MQRCHNLKRWESYLMLIRWQMILLVTFSAATLVGCKKSSVDRLVVTGTVTWKGKPIPEGCIFFDPDVKKGNRGPQGSALIKDGKFDTRFERSRGCVKGPHIAAVHAFDGVSNDKSKSVGKRMFAAYSLALEIPAEGGELNIIVPDNVKPASIQNEPE